MLFIVLRLRCIFQSRYFRYVCKVIQTLFGAMILFCKSMDTPLQRNLWINWSAFFYRIESKICRKLLFEENKTNTLKWETLVLYKKKAKRGRSTKRISHRDMRFGWWFNIWLVIYVIGWFVNVLRFLAYQIV
jgi:hypothetical protein